MKHAMEIQFPFIYTTGEWEQMRLMVDALVLASTLPDHSSLPKVAFYNLGKTLDDNEEFVENGLIYSPILLGETLQEDFAPHQKRALEMLLDVMQEQQETELTWREFHRRWNDTLYDVQWWEVEIKDVFQVWSENNHIRRTKQALIDNIGPVSRTTTKKM